ncbi:Neural proliferation differentiation and control protein 1 [Varanus komodoensis]|nr:Neural proliferation differentiation and control protein 1 [Varanus komodoensis]
MLDSCAFLFLLLWEVGRQDAEGSRATVPGVDGEIDLVAEALAKQEGSQPRSRQHGLIVVCTAAGIAALVVAAVCWCRLQKEIRLAQKTDYPAHMASAPPSYDKISPGDKKLAQTAQMYHYQHQKQQMLSMEKNKDEPKVPEPVSSDEENEEGDFTVYECPGLAPTGEMEVKNPLFDDSPLHPAAPNLRP